MAGRRNNPSCPGMDPRRGRGNRPVSRAAATRYSGIPLHVQGSLVSGAMPPERCPTLFSRTSPEGKKCRREG
jgi:hypothetical protein